MKVWRTAKRMPRPKTQTRQRNQRLRPPRSPALQRSPKPQAQHLPHMCRSTTKLLQEEPTMRSRISSRDQISLILVWAQMKPRKEKQVAPRIASWPLRTRKNKPMQQVLPSLQVTRKARRQQTNCPQKNMCSTRIRAGETIASVMYT